MLDVCEDPVVEVGERLEEEGGWEEDGSGEDDSEGSDDSEGGGWEEDCSKGGL